MNGGQSDSDSRRLLIALLAAVLLHVCFAALAIIRLAQPPLQLTTLSVDLAPGTLGGMALTTQPGPGRHGPAGAAPQVPGPPAQTRAAAPNASHRRKLHHPDAPPGTDGKRIAADRAELQDVGITHGWTTQLHAVGNLARAGAGLQALGARSWRASTGSASQGGGGGTAPSRAVGVLVQGGGQAPAKGSLDLGSLDKSLAQGRQAGGQGGTALQGGGGQEG